MATIDHSIVIPDDNNDDANKEEDVDDDISIDQDQLDEYREKLEELGSKMVRRYYAATDRTCLLSNKSLSRSLLRSLHSFRRKKSPLTRSP